MLSIGFCSAGGVSSRRRSSAQKRARVGVGACGDTRARLPPTPCQGYHSKMAHEFQGSSGNFHLFSRLSATFAGIFSRAFNLYLACFFAALAQKDESNEFGSSAEGATKIFDMFIVFFNIFCATGKISQILCSYKIKIQDNFRKYH